MVLKVENRDYYTYKCKVCGMECVKVRNPESTVPVTKLGNYGDNATPTPTELAEVLYTATTISFTAASGSDPATINDSAVKFVDNRFLSEMNIRVSTTSGTNDGDYSIAARGVSRDEIRLVSTDSLTTENAATAGTVVISRLMYQPSVSTGCSFCGSLSSRGSKH